MMTAEGRKSPVHVHVDRETPVHVHLKKKKKGKPGVPTAVEVCSNSVFFQIPNKMWRHLQEYNKLVYLPTFFKHCKIINW